MYRIINTYADAVVAGLQLERDVTRHLALHDLARRVDASSDMEFQRKFRRYWGLNAARLSDSFHRAFFRLLEDVKQAGTGDIEVITRELAAVPTNLTGRRTLQFSFASKLLHTVDPHAPVYDSFVASFYFFLPPGSEKPLDERLEQLIGFYRFLQSEYQRVIREGLLDAAIQRFRSHFDVREAFTDERIIDLLLWSYVGLLRSGAQRRDELLFE